MTAMFFLWVCAACSDPSPMDQTPRPEVPVAEEPAAATPPAAPGPTDIDAELTVPSTIPLGDAYTAVFSRMGPNGCYRQSEVTTQVNNGEKKVFHRYTTSSEGEMCTEALVPGGFSAEVMLAERGEWRGTVQVDGQTVSTYTITVQ